MKPFNRLAAVTVLLAALLPAAPAAAVKSAVTASTPQTIPALREWTAAAGSFTFGSSTRIVVDSAASSLTDEGATFAEDLVTFTGVTVPVVRDTAANTRPGDIYLGLGSTDTALGTEGYTMTVGSAVQIRARADAGAYYGTRSVLQLLRQSATIPAGTARDWPTKPERGLMVDVGRKFFTVDWLKKHLKELGYLKMNYFHFHLSDNFGFRLESSKHPAIVSEQHYTKAQVAELVALAAKHHITIVPEIDMPAHMDHVLKAYPELALDDTNGNRSFYHLDLSEPGAYTLARDLIEEYMPLFPAKYWHLGADEYVAAGDYPKYPQLLNYARSKYGPNATGKDTYYGFINFANDIVRAGGKTTRMWNDGIKHGDGTIQPAANIVVDYWFLHAGDLTPQQLLDRGHTLSNEHADEVSYYALGGGRPNNPYVYQSWTPDLFHGGSQINAPARNLGTKLHVWCDVPTLETEDQIATGIFMSLRVLAQQTWGSPKLVGAYNDFIPIAATISHAPGWPIASRPGNRALHRPVTVSSIETPDFPGPFAVDGDLTTRWSAAPGDPQWIQVDLGAPTSISQVLIRWEAAFARDYQIQVSNDGTTWTAITAVRDGDGGVDHLTGLAGTGRYVRLLVTRRASNFLSLWELEVFSAAPKGRSGTYQLTAAGRSLDNPHSHEPGRQMTVWDSHPGVNQQWTLSLGTDGAYTLVNGLSGFCLDLTGAGTIVHFPCHGGEHQRWFVEDTAAGVKIVSKKSGQVMTGGTSNGAAVTPQADSGSAVQRWSLTPS